MLKAKHVHGTFTEADLVETMAHASCDDTLRNLARH